MNTTPSPLISIISVNYNQEEHTREFLDSVYQADYDNLEVILVDNGSKEPMDANLDKEYDNLTCIFSEKNLGFAGGNNLGIEKAKGDILFFLNNDTIVQKGFFSKIVEFFENNNEVGILSPKVLYPNGIVQYGGSSGINLFTMRGKTIGLFEDDHGQYDHISESVFPHGAAMAVPRKVVEKAGNIPEIYFLYYEEYDWCLKIKDCGYKMFYFGDTSIIHKESISIGKSSPLKTYYMSRNRILFVLRNAKGLTRICGVLFSVFIALPKNSLVFLFRREYRQLQSLWKGVLWHINPNI